MIALGLRLFYHTRLNSWIYYWFLTLINWNYIILKHLQGATQSIIAASLNLRYIFNRHLFHFCIGYYSSASGYHLFWIRITVVFFLFHIISVFYHAASTTIFQHFQISFLLSWRKVIWCLDHTKVAARLLMRGGCWSWIWSLLPLLWVRDSNYNLICFATLHHFFLNIFLLIIIAWTRQLICWVLFACSTFCELFLVLIFLVCSLEKLLLTLASIVLRLICWCDHGINWIQLRKFGCVRPVAQDLYSLLLIVFELIRTIALQVRNWVIQLPMN